MTDRRLFESVEGIPYGLIACEIKGEQKHIMRISPRAVWLRSSAPLSDGAPLSFSFYEPANGGYAMLYVLPSACEKSDSSLGADVFCLTIDDAAYARAVRSSLRLYGTYVSLKSEGDTDSVYETLTGRSADDETAFAASFDAALHSFSERCACLPDTDAELAVSLSGFPLYDMFENCPRDAFEARYAALCGLPEGFFGNRRIRRLYIGNPNCRFLLPEPIRLKRMTEKAMREGFSVAVELPALQGSDEKYFFDALTDGTEVICNDWGLLRACPERLTPVLGSRLNRYRKDPRLSHRAKTIARFDSAAEDPLWRKLLKEKYRVRRFEYESCPTCPEPHGARNTLRAPYYTTNCGQYCTLRALIERGDRSLQQPYDGCIRHCERVALLYPETLNMIGIGNALLAFDGTWSDHLSSAFDRLVLNFPPIPKTTEQE